MTIANIRIVLDPFFIKQEQEIEVALKSMSKDGHKLQLDKSKVENHFIQKIKTFT